MGRSSRPAWPLPAARQADKDEVNCIDHLLHRVPYTFVPHEQITLPSRVFDPKYERPRFTSALHVSAHFGFMQRPDIPRLLEEAQGRGCSIKLDDVT